MTSSTALADARTFLFVPGNRPERFEKAARSGADAIVLDLEDAVPSGDKAAAREAIAHAWKDLRAIGTPLLIRTNVLDRAPGLEDLEWLSQLVGAAGAMLPKVESAAALRCAHNKLPALALLPLIESAAGWNELREIAAVPGVLRLVVGHLDFMADTGLLCGEDEAELTPLRFAVAMVTRLQRLAPAVDGVTVAIQDEERLREDTRRALRLGFGAKLCIHPSQVSVVHDVLAPTQQQVEWARRAVAADLGSGGAAVQMDGRMVDLPVVLQARRLLARLRPASRTAPAHENNSSGKRHPL